MVKITYTITNIIAGLIGTVGLILSFMGIAFQQFFPWVKFKSDRFLLPRVREGEKFWEWVYYRLSPFIVHYSSETGETVTTWFYRLNMTITGVIGLIGIVVGCVGIALKMRKLTFAGGLTIVFSMITFATSLPGVYPSFAWGLGAKLTFYGAIVIIASAAVGVFFDTSEKNREYVARLIKAWQRD